MHQPIQPISGQRGRPASRYKVDNSYFEHNLHTLVDAIFSIVPIEDNAISKMAGYISSKIDTGDLPSVINKLNDLIIGLNKQNYKARWETQYKGPVIFFSNCPYRQIVPNHSFLCELDKRIIESFIGKKVTLTQTINHNSPSICKFQITI